MPLAHYRVAQNADSHHHHVYAQDGTQIASCPDQASAGRVASALAQLDQLQESRAKGLRPIWVRVPGNMGSVEANVADNAGPPHYATLTG